MAWLAEVVNGNTVFENANVEGSSGGVEFAWWASSDRKWWALARGAKKRHQLDSGDSVDAVHDYRMMNKIIWGAVVAG